MPIDDPDERARRAVIRALSEATEGVDIIVDEGDDNPDPASFQARPRNLMSRTFSSFGVDDAGISIFIAQLKRELPEISRRIQQLLNGLEPNGLQPGVKIRLVFNVIRGELGTPP